MKATISIRAAVLGVITVVLCGNVASTSAGGKAADNIALIRLMDDQMDMKDFQAPMSLKEAFGLMMEKFSSKGKELAILVDVEAFKREEPKAAMIYETQVQFQPFPRRMALSQVLRLMLAKIDEPRASFVIRNGAVEITTSRQASTKRLLTERVMANFHQSPFDQAVEELSALTGASVVLDNRLGDKLKVPITASLRNDVTLKCALRMLADMADLKVVFLPSAIYITDPINAQKLETEMRGGREITNHNTQNPNKKGKHKRK
jgi:hypothetical protein